MAKKILLVCAALVAAFVVIVGVILLIASRQPADFRLTRSATVAAAPAVVFEQINDMHKFQDWSPWAKLDPNCKVTYAGPAAGTGASFSWSGNSNVGEGTMTVTESRPNEAVVYRLEFRKPMAMTSSADFTLKSEGGQTAVTWGMSMQKNLFMKAMGLFVDCDKMMGKDFEKGLADLKTIAETQTLAEKRTR